ncbi:MAG: thioredoxin-disulfide reductase [Bacilli bacterium]|nr:thioredoxin-disulfide reductase [Bacilli bacterium]
MYDIIIIGAGPAGMTAAIYAARANKKVLVLEALNYGGEILNTLKIENYPVEENISGFDFATKLYNQIIKLGVEVKLEKVISINEEKQVKTNENTYTSKAIIIATGLKTRKLDLPLEEELTGKGISYCATCDGAFFKNKDVAVVGGGNTALEDALYLSDICNKVYLIHRRNEFRADPITVNKVLEKDNIKVLYDSIITKINGSNYLESIEVNNELLNVNGLFIAIGKIPHLDYLNNLIETNELGYIKSNELCHTNIEGIFVAGDIREKTLRQLVTATSDGAVAATEAIKYINK